MMMEEGLKKMSGKMLSSVNKVNLSKNKIMQLQSYTTQMLSALHPSVAVV